MDSLKETPWERYLCNKGDLLTAEEVEMINLVIVQVVSQPNKNALRMRRVIPEKGIRTESKMSYGRTNF